MKRVEDAVIVGIEVDGDKMVKKKMGLQLHSVHTGPSTGHLEKYTLDLVT